MRRKILTFILALCFCLVVFPVYAETGKTEISFQVGHNTIKINGKDIQVEKPFVENGVTLVPLRVITEAFGAEVVWNSNEQSVTLKYNQKVIKLYIGKKKAQVDGVDYSLPEEPVVVNGVTMVPLRFVTENFGAEVKYDDRTAQISVIKELAGDKSIKDYALILKKTTKTQVGDSYYQWTINYPKGLKITDRNFDGSVTEFGADDESYRISVVIWKQNGETLDSLMTSERKNISGMTLVSQTKETKNSTEYIKTVFKGTKVYDERHFISRGRVFLVCLEANDYDKYKDTLTYTDILDSFRVTFTQDNSTEDLSDINANGYRTYNDKNLKFSMDILPEWNQVSNEKQPNIVKFRNTLNNKSIDSINIAMYSRESGTAAKSFADRSLQFLADEMNPDYYKILKEEDGTLNGVACRKIYYTQELFGSTIYSCNIFLVGSNYKYIVFYHLSEETYQNAALLAAVEKALSSFKFTEPDFAKIGSLMDPDMMEVTGVNKKQSTKYKWSMELPADWTSEKGNNDENVVSYGKDLKTVNMVVLDQVPLEGFISVCEEELNKKIKMGYAKLIGKDKINEKGTEIYRYITSTQVLRVEIDTTEYIFVKNGYLYIVEFTSPKYTQSSKNIQTMAVIWQSMKFE